MENMKFKVGDRVKVKSLQWFNENKNNNYDVVLDDGWCFSKPMSIFCGKELIIKEISHTTNPPYYEMKDNMFAWTDEMIEGLVEEENKFGTALNPIEPKSNANCLTQERADALATKIDEELPSGNPYEWECPEGYQFVDENGNVINAQKIVLEKKKKEYPKTYDECCKVLNVAVCDLDILDNMLDTTEIIYRKNLDRLLNSFRKLLICRDAYWKIAGEEMGLGKPWEPSGNEGCFVISRSCGEAFLFESTGDCEPFEFPTKEMRDAFYENFKEEIEICKELL